MNHSLVFQSGVYPAQCECHKGQFHVVVFFVSPEGEKTPAHAEPFATEAEAEANVERITREVADFVMQEAGIEPEQISDVKVFKKEDDKPAFETDHNQTLH